MTRSAIRLLLCAVALNLAPSGSVQAETLRLARNADIKILDPVLTQDNIDIWILPSIYETLLRPTADGQGVEPGLASAWTVAADGLSIDLTMRAGVTFSNGSPLTPEDAKWSLDRARQPNAGFSSFLLQSIASVDVMGTDLVRVTLTGPDASIIAALATFNAAILPAKLVLAAPGATVVEKATAFARNPVGTGPFKLTGISTGTGMTLVRNETYWDKAADGAALPYLDGIDISVMPDDASRVLALAAGEVDAVEYLPFEAAASKADGVGVTLFPSSRVVYLQMNMRENLPDGSANPLASAEVRQALNLAVDKGAVIKAVTFGLGQPLTSFMASTTPLHHDMGPLYPVDLEQAKALLAKAGFADGFEVHCDMLAGNSEELASLQIVQAMWAQVGVALVIDQMDYGSKSARYDEELFQMQTGAWTNDINDPSEITDYFANWPTIHSMRTGYRDEALEAKFLESQRTVDVTARGALYTKIQQTYVEAAPLIFIYETPFVVGLRDGVTEFRQSALGIYDFAHTRVAR